MEAQNWGPIERSKRAPKGALLYFDSHLVATDYHYVIGASTLTQQSVLVVVRYAARMEKVLIGLHAQGLAFAVARAIVLAQRLSAPHRPAQCSAVVCCSVVGSVVVAWLNGIEWAHPTGQR